MLDVFHFSMFAVRPSRPIVSSFINGVVIGKSKPLRLIAIKVAWDYSGEISQRQFGVRRQSRCDDGALDLRQTSEHIGEESIIQSGVAAALLRLVGQSVCGTLRLAVRIKVLILSGIIFALTHVSRIRCVASGPAWKSLKSALEVNA